MSAQIALSLAGLGGFAIYFVTSVIFLVIFIAIYTSITPYHEFELIRLGDHAAAVSISGAILGFVIPLASAVAHSVSLMDMAIWGFIAMAVQVLVFIFIKHFITKFDSGESISMSFAIFIAAVSVACGILNAACMTY